MLIVCISIFLDNLISIFINTNSIFFPLFTLLSIIFLNLLNIEDFHYFLLTFIIGFVYDIFFSNSIFMNTSIFLFLGLIIYLIFKKINYNFFNVLITSILIIILYRIITYFLFLLNSNVYFNINIIFKGIYSSLIINIIYIIVVYFITDKIAISSKSDN